MTNERPSSRVAPRLGAVVLCGGQSRRMGQSKAWLSFGSEPLLVRVVRRLSTIAAPIVVVRARGQTLPELPNHVFVVDDAAPDRGPLQGLAAGLSVLQTLADAAFVSSTDAPFVEPLVIEHLVALRGNAYDLAVPRALGRQHPLAAVYAVSVLPTIEDMLKQDQLRMMDLVQRLHTRVVEEDELRRIDPTLRFLMNVNTPEDYAAALAVDVAR